MKRKSILFGLALMIVCGISYIGDVNAITKEEFNALDPDNKITLPDFGYSTEGTEKKIIIDENVKEYELYYQWIMGTDEDCENLNKFEDELTKLNDEISEYQNNATEEEKETEEYKNKISEYQEKLDALVTKTLEIIPNYNDNAWIQTTDGIVARPGGKAFTLWVKLVDKTNNTTSYKVEFYHYEEKTNSTTSTTTNTTTSTKNNWYDSQETVQTSINPSTGISEYIICAVVLALVIGSGIIYLKSRKLHN